MPRYAQSSRNAELAIKNRESFDTYGNLSGVEYAHGTVYGHRYGQLRGMAKDRFVADAPTIDYIVLSYSTPIAWHTIDGRWTYVARRFSASTDKAQSTVRSALYNESPTVLQERQHLTPRQGELLYYAYLDTGNVIDGKRTAKSVAVLVEKGLVRLVPNGNTFVLTDKGRDYFA